MIDKVTSALAANVDRASKKTANALEKVTDGLHGKPDNVIDQNVVVRLNSAYNENYLNARNAQDAMSYMQTREGALHSVTGMLQQLRGMAVGLGNPALNDSDRNLLTSQANALMEDIDSMAKISNFNSHSLIADTGLESLGLDGLEFGSDMTITAIDNALSVVNRKSVETGGAMSTLEARIDNLMIANVNLARANEAVNGSLTENIIELNNAVREQMVAVKALDVVLDLDKNKVMSLLDMLSPTDKEKDDEKSGFSIREKDD